MLEKCKGCIYNNCNTIKGCEKKYRKHEIKGTISKYISRKDTWQLEINTNMLDITLRKEKCQASNLESNLKEILIESKDIEIIKKQRISNELVELLVEKHNSIRKNNKQEELIFYTDGSLIRGKKDNPSLDRMGAGWLQVDSKEEDIINEGAFGARGWPSSTKAELLVIWCVVLITPSESKIKIYTDSAAAIASIDNAIKYETSRKRIKKKNYSLVINIEDTIRTKKIEVELIKVKGHSDNKWNNRADSLAKEGANLQDNNRIIKEPIARSNVSLCWENTVIENPTRDFVKEVFNIKNNVNWSCSAAIKKLETTKEEREYGWSLLWKKIRSQSGVKCISSRGSKKLSTLFKCIQEKMPILKELATR